MKKKVRIYKSGGTQGKVLNPTAQWMAQVGGQQQPQYSDDQLVAAIIQMFQQGLEPEDISSQLSQTGVDPQRVNQLVVAVYKNLNQQQASADQTVRTQEEPMEQEMQGLDMSQYYAGDDSQSIALEEDMGEELVMSMGGKVPSKRKWVNDQIKLIKKQQGGPNVSNKADDTDTGVRSDMLQSFVGTLKANSDDAAMKEYLESQYDQMQEQMLYDQYLPEAQFGGLRPGQQRRIMRRANRMLGNIPTSYFNRAQGFPGQINLMTGFGATPFAGFAPQSPFFMQGPQLANIDVRRVGLFGKPKEYTINFAGQPQFTQNDIQYMIEQEMRNRTQTQNEDVEEVKKTETTTSSDNTNVEAAGGNTELPSIEDIKVENTGGSGKGKQNTQTSTTTTTTEPVVTQSPFIEPIDWSQTMDALFTDDSRNPKNLRVDIDAIRKTDPLAMAAPQAAMADDAFWQGFAIPGLKGTGRLRLPKITPKFTFKPGAIPGKGPITPPMFSRPGLPKGPAGYLPKGPIIPPYTGPTPGRVITTPRYYPPGTQLKLPFQDGGFVDPESGLYKFIYGGNEPFQDYFAEDSKNVNDPYFRNGGLMQYQGDEAGSEVSNPSGNDEMPAWAKEFLAQLPAREKWTRPRSYEEYKPKFGWERSGMSPEELAYEKEYHENYSYPRRDNLSPLPGEPGYEEHILREQQRQAIYGNPYGRLSSLNQMVPALYGMGNRGRAINYAGSWTKQKGMPYVAGTNQVYQGPWNNPQLSSIDVKKSDWRGRPKKYTYNFLVDNPNSLANYQPNITDWKGAANATGQYAPQTPAAEEKSGTRLRMPISGILRHGPKIWREQYGPDEAFDVYGSTTNNNENVSVSDRQQMSTTDTGMLPPPDYNLSDFMDLPNVEQESIMLPPPDYKLSEMIDFSTLTPRAPMLPAPEYDLSNFMDLPDIQPEDQFTTQPLNEYETQLLNEYNTRGYNPIPEDNRINSLQTRSFTPQGMGNLIQDPMAWSTPSVRSNKNIRPKGEYFKGQPERKLSLQEKLDLINRYNQTLKGNVPPELRQKQMQDITDGIMRNDIRAQEGIANFGYKSPIDWKTTGPVSQSSLQAPGLENPFTIDQNWSNPITGDSPAITYNPETGSYENDLMGDYNEANKLKVAVDQKRKDMYSVNWNKVADDINLYGNMALDFIGQRGDSARQQDMLNRLTSDYLFPESPNDRGTYNMNTGEQFREQGFRGVYSAKYGGHMGYQEGGETYMSEEQIREFLANGGEIEFI